MAVDPSLASIFDQCFQTPKTQEEREVEQKAYKGHQDLVLTLPLEPDWGYPCLRLYHGFWIPEHFLAGLIAFREHFKPRASDILLASYAKSGTAWLRALTFYVINRHSIILQEVEYSRRSAKLMERIFSEGNGLLPDLTVLPDPRLLTTHVPYSLLPDLVKDSECKIIYICREPKDTLVSMWHFTQALRHKNFKNVTLHEACELFCTGKSLYGPIWDHHLEFWQESLRRKEKILFLKYEGLMEDPEGSLRKLAEFVRLPFSEAEEREGVVQEIVKLCSFEKLRSLEADDVGLTGPKQSFPYFRRGKVGDWVNHLSPPMAQKLDNITEQKLQGSGLCFT